MVMPARKLYKLLLNPSAYTVVLARYYKILDAYDEKAVSCFCGFLASITVT
jgi:hypothetical protein